MRLMLANFEANLRAALDEAAAHPTHLDAVQLAGAEKIEQAVRDVGAASATPAVAPVSNASSASAGVATHWTALKTQMQIFVDLSGYTNNAANGSARVEGGKDSAAATTLRTFRAMVAAARTQAFRVQRRALLKVLAGWHAQRITALQALVKVEQAVQVGVVPVQWLHRGESAALRTGMVALSTSDHDRKPQDNITAETRQVEDGDNPAEVARKRQKLEQQVEQEMEWSGMP